MTKKEETIEVLGKIYDYTLEEIMGDRFGQYAKDIIQNRAIPDVRDGLKPDTVLRFIIILLMMMNVRILIKES